MLPILRVIPVGGVLLAIAILILALNPPGDPRAHLTDVSATGALISRELHPEWPQFLMLAALRRADELNRLRALPDTPVPLPPEAPLKAARPPEVVAVPNNATDAQPEDVTGTIVQSPNASIPVDIGETSSTELPVIPREEQPPVVIMPERAKLPHESNAGPEPAKPPATSNATAEPAKRAAKTRVRHVRRARPAPAKQQASVQFNFFDVLFGNDGASRATANAKRSPVPVTSAQ